MRFQLTLIYPSHSCSILNLAVEELKLILGKRLYILITKYLWIYTRINIHSSFAHLPMNNTRGVSAFMFG